MSELKVTDTAGDNSEDTGTVTVTPGLSPRPRPDPGGGGLAAPTVTVNVRGWPGHRHSGPRLCSGDAAAASP